MNVSLYDLVALDLPAALTATCAAMACALLGNFLLLRRLSLMGDSISHSVLPGIVLAFLFTGSRLTWPVFMGAAVAGMCSVFFVELVHRFGRLETGAAMGVVFSIFFAAGVLLIEQAAARNIDLDPDCLLHGQLETIFWYPPATLGEFLSWQTLTLVPSELSTSLAVLLATCAFVALFYKELTIAAFDPETATALGFRASLLHTLTMLFLAAAVVASFEAVGSILVIAMIICPPASARMYTDRLSRQIILSLGFAAVSALGGYALGAFGPQLLGFQHSLNAAGMMASLSGILLLFSALFAPSYGIVPRKLRQMRLALQISEEDILAALFKAEETDSEGGLPEASLPARTSGTPLFRYAFSRLLRDGQIAEDPARLLPRGRDRARTLVRSHRLWEAYLVRQGGADPQQVHQKAERLEHFTAPEIQNRLAEQGENPRRDPHGRKIPPDAG